jgi:hypothetical protein
VTATVHLSTTPGGQAVLTCGGTDLIKTIGCVRAVELHAAVAHFPTVTLHLSAPFEYDGPADIQVVPPAADTVGAFLDAVDAEELEECAAGLGGGFGGPGTGESFILALKTMLEADGA